MGERPVISREELKRIVEAAIPVWLYLNRTDKYGLRVRRFGSRRPLRLVLTICDGDHMPATYMLGVGKVGVQFGVWEAVTAGHSGMPPGSRFHTWFLRRSRAIGLSWDGP